MSASSSGRSSSPPMSARQNRLTSDVVLTIPPAPLPSRPVTVVSIHGPLGCQRAYPWACGRGSYGEVALVVLGGREQGTHEVLPVGQAALVAQEMADGDLVADQPRQVPLD
jgi:hypothetical protein